jgi:hypothetical protein
MARYNPTAEVKIAKPCGERWEAMPGNSRVRHCDACGRDVINAASLTPEQIEEHIRAALNGTPMPCMRLVQFEDGSLLTAQSERRSGLVQRGLAALSMLTVLATTAGAQHASATRDAMLTGRVTDTTGAGIPGVSVKLQQPNHADVAAKTAADGTFKIETTPGEYALSADRNGFQHLSAQGVVLHEGAQDLAQPLKLEVGALMGEVVVVKDTDKYRVKTESPKTERKLETVASPRYPTPARR